MPNDTDILHEKMEHTQKEKPIQSSEEFTEQEVDLQKPLSSFLRVMKIYF